MTRWKRRHVQRSEDKAPEFAPLSNLDRAILNSAQRQTTARIGGKTEEITVLEALVTKTAHSGLEGNSHAQWLFLDRVDRAQEHAREKLRQDLELGRWLKARQAVRLAEAKRAGIPEASVLPHPEDIVLDHEKGVSFVGPVSDEEYRACQRQQRIRDAYLLQEALDWCLDGGPRRPAGRAPGGALKMANLANAMLPPRLRLTDADMVDRQYQHNNLTKRDLLKATHRAWASVGNKLPRGTPSMPTDTFDHVMDAIGGSLKAYMAQRNDPGAQSVIVDRLAAELMLLVSDTRRDGQRETSG